MWISKTTWGLLRNRHLQSFTVFQNGQLHIPTKGSILHSSLCNLHTCVRHQTVGVRLLYAPLTCNHWARFLGDLSGSDRSDAGGDKPGAPKTSSSGSSLGTSWKSFRRKRGDSAEETFYEGPHAIGQKEVTEEELAKILEMLREEKRMLKELKTLKKRQSDKMNVYVDVWDAKTDYLLHDEVLKKFGSFEMMQREKKRRQRDYGYELHYEGDKQTKPSFLKALRTAFTGGGESSVVLWAISVNFLCAVFKGLVWMKTGSSSMFAEFLHSLGDLLNQLLLGYALFQSRKEPDELHPYGYKNHLFIWPIVSGVGIFCFGFGLTLYHGLQGIFQPMPFTSMHLNWSLPVLFASLISEGSSLTIAYRELLSEANKQKISYKAYLLKGGDPLVKVVFLEDLVAVLGVVVCSGALWLSDITGSRIYDSLGSIVISMMLGGVSSFLIQTNAKVLVGQSIPYQDEVKRQLEDDVFVHMVMDDKGTDLGDESRFKAEVGFDGRRISLDYLQTMDMDVLLEECKSIRTTEQLEDFLSTFGEEVIDRLGYHIDRIEADLKQSFPEIKHIDIEPN